MGNLSMKSSRPPSAVAANEDHDELAAKYRVLLADKNRLQQLYDALQAKQGQMKGSAPSSQEDELRAAHNESIMGTVMQICTELHGLLGHVLAISTASYTNSKKGEIAEGQRTTEITLLGETLQHLQDLYSILSTHHSEVTQGVHWTTKEAGDMVQSVTLHVICMWKFLNEGQKSVLYRPNQVQSFLVREIGNLVVKMEQLMTSANSSFVSAYDSQLASELPKVLASFRQFLADSLAKDEPVSKFSGTIKVDRPTDNDSERQLEEIFTLIAGTYFKNRHVETSARRDQSGNVLVEVTLTIPGAAGETHQFMQSFMNGQTFPGKKNKRKNGKKKDINTSINMR